MVERLNGIQEVRGSIPLISTTNNLKRFLNVLGCFIKANTDKGEFERERPERENITLSAHFIHSSRYDFFAVHRREKRTVDINDAAVVTARAAFYGQGNGRFF